MNRKYFDIAHEWHEIRDVDPLLAATSAKVGIRIDRCNAMFNANTESNQTSETSDLSLYPLAAWFARSWWRLHYETRDTGQKCAADPVWRLAHELAAAGEGYVWPNLVFFSDGDTMTVTSHQTSYAPEASPINYLSDFRALVPLGDFTDGVSACIESVLERMKEKKIPTGDNELFEHWNAITVERSNPEFSKYRKVEAMLGYNPDEAEESMMREFLEKGHRLGNGVVDELASGLAAHSRNIVQSMNEISAAQGIRGKFNLPEIPCSNGLYDKPWEIGCKLAGELRRRCGVADVVENKLLAEFLGVTGAKLLDRGAPVPITVGIADEGNVHFLFRSAYPQNRRFHASRLIADRLLADSENTWYPVSSAITRRQKIQRAFAGEFLCPFEKLMEFLDGKYDDESLSEAAVHFQVSEKVPQTHLVNHRVLEADCLNEDIFLN